MQSIEELAIQKYHDNIEYFKTSHPNIIKLLDVINMAFEKGDMQPQYDLEYLDGYFDVKELSSGDFLYANNSNDISTDFSKIITLQKSSYSYEGLPVYHSKSISDMASDKANAMEGVYPIMDYVIDHTNESDSMKSVEKFIFVGVALGFHIEKLDAKLNAQEYLIIEDDLELFRLSLFTISYVELAKRSKLTFSIADDEQLFAETMATFLEVSFINNRYLKYAHFPTHSKEKLRQIQNAIMAQGFISFQYKAELEKNLRPLEYMNDGYKILNLSKPIENKLLGSKPVLLITAGPSFHKNIEWLKANHERFIIVAVSATLKTLYQNNIRPTVVTHIDGFSASLKHYESFPIKEFLKDSLIVLGPFADGLIKRFFPKENVFYYEEDTEYIKGFKGPQMPCVGSFSLLMSLILGTKELYLLGLDLALDQKTGATHSGNHAYNQEYDLTDKESVKDTMSLRENFVGVRGNFEKTVYTNGVFNLSINSLHEFIPKIKQANQTIYNLNDGAYIESSVAKNIEDVDSSTYAVLDKQEVFTELSKILKSNSVDRLNDEDTESLKKRLENSQNIGNMIKKYASSVSKTNADAFLSDLLGLVSDILKLRNRETINIVLVYYSYFKYILPLVFDLFNTQGLKSKKQHVKRLSVMIEKELMNIEGIYTKALRNFLSGDSKDEKEAYYTFMASLYNIKQEEVKECTKNTIGFLAEEGYYTNASFVQYIKKLYAEIPASRFKVFYFYQQKKEEVEAIFSEEIDRFEFVIPENIQEIVDNVEVFSGPDTAIADSMIKAMAKYNNNIIVMNYPDTEELADTKLNDLIAIQKDSLEYKLLIELGVKEESITESEYRFIISYWRDFFADHNIKYTFKHDIEYGNFLVDIIKIAFEHPIVKEQIIKANYKYFDMYDVFQ